MGVCVRVITMFVRMAVWCGVLMFVCRMIVRATVIMRIIMVMPMGSCVFVLVRVRMQFQNMPGGGGGRS